MSELKACPFCGEQAKVYGGGVSQETEIVISSKCGANAPPRIWNNRPAENRIKAQAYTAGFKHGLALPIPELPRGHETGGTAINWLEHNINRMAESAGIEYAQKLEGKSDAGD